MLKSLASSTSKIQLISRGFGQVDGEKDCENKLKGRKVQEENQSAKLDRAKEQEEKQEIT